MTEHKKQENRVRLSDEFYEYVQERCEDKGYAGEWLEKQSKKLKAENERLKKENERLKTQETQSEGTTRDLAVRQNSQEVLTPTEIISPNVQTVMIRNTEIKVSDTQKERKVWKDGEWVFSMKGAGDLSFLDSCAKLREDHTRELMKIKINAHRQIQEIKIEGLRERDQIRKGNYQDGDEETPYKKYDPNALAHWCSFGKGRVYPWECKTCGQSDCKDFPKRVISIARAPEKP